MTSVDESRSAAAPGSLLHSSSVIHPSAFILHPLPVVSVRLVVRGTILAADLVDIPCVGIAAINALLRRVVRIVRGSAGMVLLLVVAFLVESVILPRSSVRPDSIRIEHLLVAAGGMRFRIRRLLASFLRLSMFRGHD
jgi:hypothetical protein